MPVKGMVQGGSVFGYICRGHVVKQALPAGDDMWVVSRFTDEPSPYVEDAVYMDKVLLWLLVEHRMESSPEPDGTVESCWIQFSIEPWCSEHLDYQRSNDRDPFACQQFESEHRVCGTRQEMEAKANEFKITLALNDKRRRASA